MRLWIEWFRCVRQLRGSCSRSRTFAWLVLVLAAVSTRLDLAGVTSFVRVLPFYPSAYRRLLHLFHSRALSLERLTALWVQLVLRVFSPYMAGPYLVCLADGVKAPKEGRKMPAVKSLHQSADSNSKPPFIMGHSFQAISLLVRSASGHIAAVPLAARIHEGLVWSNRDQRTLLDRLVDLFLGLAGLCERKVLLIADAYYASGKVIRPLLQQGHHLLTRDRIPPRDPRAGLLRVSLLDGTDGSDPPAQWRSAPSYEVGRISSRRATEDAGLPRARSDRLYRTGSADPPRGQPRRAGLEAIPLLVADHGCDAADFRARGRLLAARGATGISRGRREGRRLEENPWDLLDH